MAETELGPVDVLINNAGHSVQVTIRCILAQYLSLFLLASDINVIIVQDAFEKIPIEDFEKQVRVNYLSAVSCSFTDKGPSLIEYPLYLSLLSSGIRYSCSCKWNAISSIWSYLLRLVCCWSMCYLWIHCIFTH